eukprot:PhF_6_TR15448/c1_g1_i4/m.23994
MRTIRKLTSFPSRRKRAFLPDISKSKDISLIPKNEIEKRIFTFDYDILRGMMATAPEDRLIQGVPFKERPLNDFKSNLASPQKTGSRYDLCYNTGPAGSGKTTQLAQCMKVAAEMNFIVFGIDFNAGQTIQLEENDFLSAVKARILANALRMEWPERYNGIKAHIEEINKILTKAGRGPVKKNFEGRGLEDVIRDAKKIASVTGKPDAMEMPTCLVVDELLLCRQFTKGDKASERKYLQRCLSLLCAVMDKSLKQPDKRNHLHLVVSVYNLVSLRAMQTKSLRNLVHLPLPPILPTTFAKESISKLPVFVRAVLNETERKAIPKESRKLAAIMVLLLRSTCGHPRRIEALFASINLFINNLPNINTDRQLKIEDLTDSQVDDLKDVCETAMNFKLRISSICSSVTDESVSEKLLKALFVVRPSSDVMVEATIHHYQIVPLNDFAVGYVPVKVIDTLLKVNSEKNHATQRLWYENSLYGILQADEEMQELLSEPITPENRSNHSKVFEKMMCETFALIFGLNAVYSDCSHPLLVKMRDKNKIQVKRETIDMTKIEVQNFPWCDAAPHKEMALERSLLLDKIFEVGSSPASKEGVYFQPTSRSNVGWDNVYVLPLEGMGRVIILEQDKEWFFDNASGNKNVVAEFRWGRQYFLQNRVCPRNDTQSMDNPFFDEFAAKKKDEKGPTKILFMLVTPDPIDWTKKAEMEASLEAMKTTEEGETCRSPGVLNDELYVSLKDDMEHWCPTIAFASMANLSLRDLLQ